MKILQINTCDLGGGAEGVSRNLHLFYYDTVDEAALAVGRKYGDDPGVVQIDRYPLVGKNKTAHSHLDRIAYLAHQGASAHTYRNVLLRRNGRDLYRYPSSRRLLSRIGFKPDVINCHNLHGNYFDLRALPEMSREAPIIFTLHDCWLMGGHCAHSFECERWRIGCGECPKPRTPFPIWYDGSARNWADRKAIFSRFRYRISAPCQWILNKARASLLAENMVEGRVIPNGVDRRLFHQGDKGSARDRLKFDRSERIVLFVGNYARTSPWRDYSMLEEALSHPDEDITLLCVGENGDSVQRGRLRVRFQEPVGDPTMMADIYRAADVYAHPAIEDTFPTVILEAMACGLPVVATSVGGIPEQVEDCRTGHLVPYRDVDSMRNRILDLLSDDGVMERMGREAAVKASQKFDLTVQANSYLRWFREFT